MTLDDKFNAAVEIVQKLPKQGPMTTSNDQKLTFYSLYKQATVGDVNTERPGIFSIIERKKWDSWKEVEGVSKDDAKQKYVAALNEMFDKISQELDVNTWLDEIDPSVRANLAIVSKN